MKIIDIRARKTTEKVSLGYDMTIEKLAREFSKQLEECIGGADMNALVDETTLNHEEIKRDKICYSHNYCDANMVMFDAFTNIIGREPEISMENDTDLRIMSEAWNRATEKVFFKI